MILKCMEKEQEQRYQSVEEFLSGLDDLEKVMPTSERVVPKRKPFTSMEISVQFKLKKLLVPALVVVALVVIALLLWKFLPRQQTVMAPKIENSIAVISFENLTGDESYDRFGKVIPNLFTVNLENTGYIHVVTLERMIDLLKQMNKEDVEIIDRELGFELCRREGIESIVLGEFSKFGDTFTTTVKVLDVETKKTLKSATSKGEGEDNIINHQIDELTRVIIQGMDITGEKLESTQFNIAELTSSSFEANDYYSRGLEMRIRGKPEESQKYFEKALEIDPSYAMAYYGLSRNHQDAGHNEAAKEAIKKALELSEKSSEKDRLSIEESYAYTFENNFDKSEKILTELVRKYPTEKYALVRLAWIYFDSEQYDEAEKIYENILDLDPTYYLALQNLVHIHQFQKNFDKAHEFSEKAVELHPQEPKAYWVWGHVYRSQQNFDAALRIYEKALSVDPDFLESYWSIGMVHADKEDYGETLKWIDRYISKSQGNGRVDGYLLRAFIQLWLGRFDRCLTDLDIAQDLADKGNYFFWPYHYIELMKRHIFLDKGEFEKSFQALQNWFEILRKSMPNFPQLGRGMYLVYGVTIDLKQNRMDSVESKLEELKSVRPEWSQIRILYLQNYLRAEAALVNKSPEDAILIFDELSASETIPASLWNILDTIPFELMPFLQDGLARVYQQMGEMDKAIAEYERLIYLIPGNEDLFMIHPLYHYRLGKLYEQKGWEGKAIDQYEKFLELWKDADPVFTEVADARKRLAGLK